MHNEFTGETLQAKGELHVDCQRIGMGEDLIGNDEGVFFAVTRGAVRGNTGEVYLIGSALKHRSEES